MSLLQEALDACAALTRRVEHLEYDKVDQALEITKLKRKVKKLEKGNRVKVLKLQRLKRVETSQMVDTSEDTVMDDASNQGRIIDELDKDDVVALMDDKEEDKKDEEAKEDEPAEVQEVVYVVTTAKLITEVVTAASEIVTAASTIIYTAEPQAPTTTITGAPIRVAAAPRRRRKELVIRDPEEESTTSLIIPADTKSKDKGKGIMVEEPKPLKKKQQVEMDEEYAKEDPVVQRYQVMKRKPQTEAQARKNMIMYLKNVAGFILDYFKGMSYDDICLIFEAKFNSNVDVLLKTKEQMEEEESKALQRINETLAERAAKRRKLNEEVEDLKRHLEIVADEDDDVYTEATPLARKTTRGAMFEKPDTHAQVWNNQRTINGQAKCLIERVVRDSSLSIEIFVQDKMSQDMITVGSTMRISLLYRGEYSQWRKRFMNYLEEQTDGEAMINSIQNEKKTQKIDRLARSLLIQGLLNDIYSLIDSNETVKDLWDALERQMRGSEYGEQDRKAVILYEYQTFKAIE
nr:DUF4219 domain-containing protein/UBN2 domain-containing protein [Tanacetum cinerariifolium]